MNQQSYRENKLQEYARKQNYILSRLSVSTGNDITFLFVEGDIDHTIVSQAYQKKNYDVRNCGGKDNVKEVVKKANKKKQMGDPVFKNNKYIGIVDADFDRILPLENTPTNVVITDYHDIDLMLINSKGFDTFIDRYIRKDIACTYSIEDIKKILYGLSLPLAYLRFFNDDRNSGLSLFFKMIHYRIWEFMDKPNIQVNIEEMIASVINDTKDNDDWNHRALKVYYPNHIAQEVRNLMQKCNYPFEEICNGHDVIHFMLYMIKHEKWGNELANRELTSDNVEKKLVMFYSSDMFLETSLHSRVQEFVNI